MANSNNYHRTSIPYIDGLSGPDSLVSNSTDMMFAYTNPGSGELTNAWTFATPAAVHTTTPMAAGQCLYETGDFTRVSDDTTYANYTLRMGWGSFSSSCDDNCSSTWGQMCLKSNTVPAGGGGFSDFPLFSSFAVGNADHCVDSDQAYNTATCSDTRRFAIFVR